MAGLRAEESPPVKTYKEEKTINKTSFTTMTRDACLGVLRRMKTLPQFSTESVGVPENSEGKQLCMKFFLRGICIKSCMRSHSMTKDNEKNIKAFIFKCREGANKPDF